MELLDKEIFADFKDATDELFLILEAARLVDGGSRLNDAAQVAKNLDEALGNLSDGGLGSDLQQVKRVEAMIATVGQLLTLKQKTIFDPLVVGLLRMASCRANELENDWEMLVTEELGPLLRNS